MSPHEMRPNSCGSSRGALRSMSALERKPEVPASTPDEDLSPGSYWRGLLRGPSQLVRRWDFSEATRPGPCVPCLNLRGPQVCCRNSRKTRRFLRQLKKFPDTPGSTQEEHRGSCNNSRRAPVFPPHLKMRVHFPASLGKESWRSLHTSRGGSLNSTLKRNSRGHATIPKDPNVPVHSR